MNRSRSVPASLTPPVTSPSVTSVFRASPLPMNVKELADRGWDSIDVLFVTGDAYVDHPGFAAGLLGRLMESLGYRVAVLSQPDWRSADAWRAFPRPQLAIAVSAGAMDSMLNHYTANRRLRSEDAFSPDGRTGLRPDRATAVYCQRSREAFRDVPVICGGIEASLRRFAHYDYWSDKVRRSVLLDAKADLLVYGMGESAITEILRRLAAGEPVRSLRNIRGTAYRLGAKEPRPDGELVERVPSVAQVTESPEAFCEMTRQIQASLNPYRGRTLVQESVETSGEAVVVNPPSIPLTSAELDAIYALPYTRRAAPSYGASRIPALETIRDSVTVVRGCSGGCTFCGLGAHQGRFIQSRSEESVLTEVRLLTRSSEFRGTISDLGGPTANCYGLGCGNERAGRRCERSSCLYPKLCPNLCTDPTSYLRLLANAKKIPEVKRVLVASGIRMDLASRAPDLVEAIATSHTGGHLKVAPEHVSERVLRFMGKPSHATYERFAKLFETASRHCGKRQYLVPYFIAGHPGCELDDAIELAVYEASWIAPTSGSGFHSNSDDSFSVYVPHGDRSTYGRSGSHGEIRSGAIVAAGVVTVFSSGK
ncbi:MAG: YgiQ family radical SAM protein [Planctomycetia bacterium]|nr:YgiQ family radical SAM protein [Planctomycetia bacterium]